MCEGVSLDLESTERRTELEWPEEVVDLLELWSTGDDFVDDILNAVETVLAKFTLDDGVVEVPAGAKNPGQIRVGHLHGLLHDPVGAGLAELQVQGRHPRFARLALGVLGEDSGAALDDVIERLRDVSAEIARRVQPAR